MTAAPLVSIVVPAYNHARYLGGTLCSIQAQTLTSWECIVVDDGSTDDTFQVASGFAAEDSRMRAVRIANRGHSGARNHGYVLTNPGAEFVTFMDSDDLWLPDALGRLHATLEADPLAVGAHGLAEMVDETGGRLPNADHVEHGRSRMGLEGTRLVRWPLDRPTSFEVVVNGNVLNPPGLLLARRSVYQRVGRFDEQLSGAEDWDMLIRLSRYGHISFLNEVILLYRRHDSNRGAAPGIARQAWLTRCKAFHSPENTSEQQRIARLGWRAYQRDMIQLRLRSCWSHLRSGEPVRCLDAFARVPFHAFRYIRGYPTPRVVRGSEPWASRPGAD